MNKQQLATKIWESANKMRSKIEANEYKDYILGFIFYKYLSDQEIKFLKENGYTPEDIELLIEDKDYLTSIHPDWSESKIIEFLNDKEEEIKYIQQNKGYFIAYNNLFSTWLDMGSDFDVSNVRDALSAFDRYINPTHKKVFENIFNTLQTGLSKLGDSSGSQTKAIRDLLNLIKDIPMDGRQDYDVLGFIYEYLISMFAANAGKKAGEFYTPHEVSLLMSEIVADHLKTKQEISIYDPTSGSGSLLINIGKSVAKHMNDGNKITYYAQELKQNTYNLTRINLVMRGIKPDNIATRNADTLEDDWPYFDESDPSGTYEPLYVDAVVSNPPYSQNWDPTNKESDPRYSRFGLAPKSKADYAFLLHDLYHLKPQGIMTIVLPHGVLFRGGEEGEIRKNLIENNHIDTIIGLPANIFFGTGIPTIIMVLKQKRENTDVLIVDASKGFEKVGKNNKLRASDIKRIVDTVINRVDIDKYSRKVSREEIRKNEYNLNIPRYVDSSEPTESWDIYSSMFGGVPVAEIEELKQYWEALPNLKESLFIFNDTPYAKLIDENVIEIMNNHSSVKSFTQNYKSAFADFTNYLKNELLNDFVSINISKELNILSNNIFTRLNPIKLIDKYEAYQLLDNSWGTISVDLEMLQSEGFDAVKKVEPNYVIKKKKDKEEEIQEGWKGHILPFELVQQTLLKEDYDNLKNKENRISEIISEYGEILEEMSEEDKDSDAVNETGDKFVNKEVLSKAKSIEAEIKKGISFEEDSFELKILRVAKLINEEKILNKAIKKEIDELHIKTKNTIESLTNEQAYCLLEKKWIEPLIQSLLKLPDDVLHTLSDKVKTLSEKYAITFASIEEEINVAENELSSMINELTGNDYDMQGLAELQALLGVQNDA